MMRLTGFLMWAGLKIYEIWCTINYTEKITFGFRLRYAIGWNDKAKMDELMDQVLTQQPAAN